VPVIDCIEAATLQAMTLVDLRPTAHRAGSYSRPSDRQLTGVDPALARWLGR
jgi:hypothetical protein